MATSGRVKRALIRDLRIRQLRRWRGRRNGGRSGLGTTSRLAVALALFLLGTFLLLGLVGSVVAIGAYSAFSQGLPDPKALLETIPFNQTTLVTDRTGKVELARFALEQRQVVTFQQIPPVVIDATTSIEDHTFWENAGFDPAGIIAAAIDTLKGNERGGSTITQQIVRARLLPESVLQANRYERKIKEIIQSIRLTQEYPGRQGKDAIIAAYLNQNFYGNQSYGIAAAARSYFGITDLSKIDLAQAAILAGIPQSPTAYDLVTNAVTHDGKLVVPPDSVIVQRRNYILDQMQKYDLLTAGQYAAADFKAAKQEPVVLASQAQQNWRAPHFVWQVRHELGSILCGPAQADACERVDTGGYQVTTTLDWTMQQAAEKWVAAAVLGANSSNPAAYLKARRIPPQQWIVALHGAAVMNGALAAVDYRTGQVLAYVGSASYYSTSKDKRFQPQFDVLTDGWRQPGSAFKPINYVTGIENRTKTAASLFMDVSTDFGGGYQPVDADRLERGPLRLREALMLSLNIPAVKNAVEVGLQNVFDEAEKFGIHFQSPTFSGGPSIGIGTLEVHPIDLLGAFGALADQGRLMPREDIISIRDASGNVIYTSNPTPTGKRVVSPQAAYIIQNILSANTDPKQNPYWGQFEILNSSGQRRPAALKTGTSDNTKDLSAYGFLAPPADPKAPAIAVGVWMGNSDNSQPNNSVMSFETTAPLWQAFLTDISKKLPIADFPVPPNIVTAQVDAFSGLLPGPFTRRTVNEVFIDGTVPTRVDDTKVAIEVDSATGLFWQDGCVGPKVTLGILDLSHVDQPNPQFQKWDDAWVRRAMRGPGVGGGGPLNTHTTYFYEPGYMPYGASWGAPFAPTDPCPIGPSPSPSESPNVGPSPGESFPPTPSPAPAGASPTPKPTKPPKPGH